MAVSTFRVRTRGEPETFRSLLFDKTANSRYGVFSFHQDFSRHTWNILISNTRQTLSRSPRHRRDLVLDSTAPPIPPSPCSVFGETWFELSMSARPRTRDIHSSVVHSGLGDDTPEHSSVVFLFVVQFSPLKFRVTPLRVCLKEWPTLHGCTRHNDVEDVLTLRDRSTTTLLTLLTPARDHDQNSSTGRRPSQAKHLLCE